MNIHDHLSSQVAHLKIQSDLTSEPTENQTLPEKIDQVNRLYQKEQGKSKALSPEEYRLVFEVDRLIAEQPEGQFSEVKERCEELIGHFKQQMRSISAEDSSKASWGPSAKERKLVRDILTLHFILETASDKRKEEMSLPFPHQAISQIEEQFAHVVHGNRRDHIKQISSLASVVEYVPEPLKPMQQAIHSYAHAQLQAVHGKAAATAAMKGQVRVAGSQANLDAIEGKTAVIAPFGVTKNRVVQLESQEGVKIVHKTPHSRAREEESAVEELFYLMDSHVVPSTVLSSPARERGVRTQGILQGEEVGKLREKNSALLDEKLGQLNGKDKAIWANLNAQKKAFEAIRYQEVIITHTSMNGSVGQKQVTIEELQRIIAAGDGDRVMVSAGDRWTKLGEMRQVNPLLDAALNYDPEIIDRVLLYKTTSVQGVEEYHLEFPYPLAAVKGVMDDNGNTKKTEWIVPIKDGFIKEFIPHMRTLEELTTLTEEDEDAGIDDQRDQFIFNRLDDHSYYDAILTALFQFKDFHIKNIGLAPIPNEAFEKYERCTFCYKRPGETEESFHSFDQLHDDYMNGVIEKKQKIVMKDSTGIETTHIGTRDFKEALDVSWKLVLFDTDRCLGESNVYSHFRNAKGLLAMAPLRSGLLSSPIATRPLSEPVLAKLRSMESNHLQVLNWMDRMDAGLRQRLTAQQNEEISTIVHAVLSKPEFQKYNKHMKGVSSQAQHHAMVEALCAHPELWQKLEAMLGVDGLSSPEQKHRNISDQTKRVLAAQLIPRVSTKQRQAYVMRYQKLQHYLHFVEHITVPENPTIADYQRVIAAIADSPYAPLSAGERIRFKNELAQAIPAGEKAVKKVYEEVTGAIVPTYMNIARVMFDLLADLDDAMQLQVAYEFETQRKKDPDAEADEFYLDRLGDAEFHFADILAEAFKALSMKSIKDPQSYRKSLDRIVQAMQRADLGDAY